MISGKKLSQIERNLLDEAILGAMKKYNDMLNDERYNISGYKQAKMDWKYNLEILNNLYNSKFGKLIIEENGEEKNQKDLEYF